MKILIFFFFFLLSVKNLKITRSIITRTISVKRESKQDLIQYPFSINYLRNSNQPIIKTKPRDLSESNLIQPTRLFTTYSRDLSKKGSLKPLIFCILNVFQTRSFPIEDVRFPMTIQIWYVIIQLNLATIFSRTMAHCIFNYKVNKRKRRRKSIFKKCQRTKLYFHIIINV